MVVEWKGILLILSILIIALIIIKIIEKYTNINGEIKRKLFHITMGLVMLLLPHIFTSVYSVGLLGIIALVILFLLKKKFKNSLGSVLYEVDRESMRRNIFCNFCICNFLLVKRR